MHDCREAIFVGQRSESHSFPPRKEDELFEHPSQVPTITHVSACLNELILFLQFNGSERYGTVDDEYEASTVLTMEGKQGIVGLTLHESTK